MFLFVALAAVNSWLNANRDAIFIEPSTEIGLLRQYVWFFLVLASIAGILNVVNNALIATRKLFTTLNMSIIILLTAL